MAVVAWPPANPATGDHGSRWQWPRGHLLRKYKDRCHEACGAHADRKPDQSSPSYAKTEFGQTRAAIGREELQQMVEANSETRQT
jgi:hypothetical protein